MGAMDNTDDMVVGPADAPDANDANEGDYGAGDGREVLDDLREMPAGTNDPNIVGNVGPTDVPPGTDPRSDDELTTEDPNRPTAADDEQGPVD